MESNLEKTSGQTARAVLLGIADHTQSLPYDRRPGHSLPPQLEKHEAMRIALVDLEALVQPKGKLDTVVLNGVQAIYISTSFENCFTEIERGTNYVTSHDRVKLLQLASYLTALPTAQTPLPVLPKFRIEPPQPGA